MHRVVVGAVSALALVIVSLLGIVQSASMTAYGDLAEATSLPRFLHARQLVPARAFAFDREWEAAALIHEARYAAGAALLGNQHGDARLEDLSGRILQAEGDTRDAFLRYEQAGDAVRAQRALVSDVRAQRQLVTTLERRGAPGDLLADAWWKLGELQRAHADRSAHGASLDALHSFAMALTAAPNRESYLLAAGIEALKAGDDADAALWLERATEIAPGQATPFGALALARAQQHQCAQARAARATWHARSAAGTRPPEDDPRFGEALRACLSPTPHRRTPARERAAAAPASPGASPSPSPASSPLQITNVHVSPAVVRSWSKASASVHTSADVRVVAVSVGHLKPVHLERVAPGDFEGTFDIPWVPWWLRHTWAVTFTGYDLRGHSVSSAVHVDVR